MNTIDIVWKTFPFASTLPACLWWKDTRAVSFHIFFRPGLYLEPELIVTTRTWTHLRQHDSGFSNIERRCQSSCNASCAKRGNIWVTDGLSSKLWTGTTDVRQAVAGVFGFLFSSKQMTPIIWKWADNGNPSEKPTCHSPCNWWLPGFHSKTLVSTPGNLQMVRNLLINELTRSQSPSRSTLNFPQEAESHFGSTENPEQF